MSSFVLGLVIVVGGWYLIKAFANAQPSQVRGMTRKIAGVAVIVLSGFLALRGATNIAMPLFVLGLGLMGQQMAFPNGMPWSRKSPGQRSKVATSLVAMELDHDSGTMDGEVLAGPSQGPETCEPDARRGADFSCAVRGCDRPEPRAAGSLDRSRAAGVAFAVEWAGCRPAAGELNQP
jgi:hypothetical protein